MDKIRLVLTVITIAIVVIPLVGTLLAHQGTPLGLFIPPEVNELAEDLLGGDDGPGLEPPTMVGEPEYDEATHTFSVSFQYRNSFPMDITIKSLTGNIECVEHFLILGNATLSEPVSIDTGETGTLTVFGKWTKEMTEPGGHFETEHGDEVTVDAVLVDFALDIDGIQLDHILIEQEMQIPNPACEG